MEASNDTAVQPEIVEPVTDSANPVASEQSVATETKSDKTQHHKLRSGTERHMLMAYVSTAEMM